MNDELRKYVEDRIKELQIERNNLPRRKSGGDILSFYTNHNASLINQIQELREVLKRIK